MCGRFTQHHYRADIVTRLEVQKVLFDTEPRYNIASTQAVAVVVTEATTKERVLDGFQWGLVPSWAKDPAIGNKMINARSETVAEKPAFKRALQHRRCIVPADGFYEWERTGADGKVRIPHHFRRKDGALFGFAGLWEKWDSPDGSPLLSFTLITTQANGIVVPIHDRMPVILQTPEDEALWLDDTLHETDLLVSLLQPYPDDWMDSFTVSRRVNSPAVDEAGLLESIA